MLPLNTVCLLLASLERWILYLSTQILDATRWQFFNPKLAAMRLYQRKITVADDEVTSAVHLTLRQSVIPCSLGMCSFRVECLS